jgi:hypothetical protein
MTEKPPSRADRPAPRAFLRLLLGVAIGLAALAAGHTLLWRWMGDRIDAGFDAWARTRRDTGWIVEHGPPVRGGWPFAATLRLPEFRLSGGAATVPGGVEWQAEALELRLALPRIDQLVVAPSGRQRLRIAQADIPYAADRLDLFLPLEQGVLPREADLRAERLRLRAGEASAVEIEQAQAHLETSTTAIEGEPAVLLNVSIEGIALPAAVPGIAGAAGGGAPGLPRRAESLTGEIVLTGPLRSGPDLAGRAEAWREAGGTVELRGLQLRWGPVNAQARATLTLDEGLQPMGAGTLKLQGVGPAIDALAAGGVLSRRGAVTTRTVLGLLARPSPEGGGAPQVEMPLGLEDRTLTLGGRLQLLRLPPLVWPRRASGVVEDDEGSPPPAPSLPAAAPGGDRG